MTTTYQSVESEIRKDSHRNHFFRIIEEDIKEILNPHRDRFVSVACPNCDHSETREAFTKGQFSYFCCPSCDTLYVNPRPPQKLLDAFYQQSKAIAASTQSLKDNEAGRKKHIFVPRAKQILKELKKMGKSSGKLLEVGCSVGTFLEIFRALSDFSVEGVDPSDGAFAITRQKGLKVHKTTLEQLSPPARRYDVVLSFETIEHVFQPSLFVSKIGQLLRKGGYFVFTTPNTHGFDMMTLGKFYKNICAPSHLNYFNVDTIDRLLGRCGFTVARKLTPGILDVEIVRKQVAQGVAPDISPFIRHLVFNSSSQVQGEFQRFLQKNCLSGNMLVFAQKIS